MSKHQKSSRKYNASPLVIRNGLIIMVIVSLVMMITNPTIDRYISTIIQTPETEINRSDAFVSARQQTCLLDPTLSTLERAKCEELTTKKRSYMKDFLNGHVQRSDFIFLSYFVFKTPATRMKNTQPSYYSVGSAREFAGESFGLFNNIFFDSNSILFVYTIIAILFFLCAYFLLSAIKLFVLKQRN